MSVPKLSPEFTGVSASDFTDTGEWWYSSLKISADFGGESASRDEAGGEGMLRLALLYNRARAWAIFSQKSSSSECDVAGDAGA